MSFFSSVGYEPPFEFNVLRKAFEKDTFPLKVDLALEAYRTEEGQPWVLPVVRRLEKTLTEDKFLNHEYLDIVGIEAFTSAAARMLLGGNNPVLKEGKVLNVQAISGNNALRLGAVFLSRCLLLKHCYLSAPCHANYPVIFRSAGFEDCRTYRYWNVSERNLDFAGMKEDLENALEDSVVLLQVCAHNPTGVDPTQEQWKEIADLMERKKLLPFFHCANQGFATGDLEKDSWPVRYFAKRGFEMLCAQSFSKNFGLYNDRVGNFILIVKDASVLTNCRTQCASLVDGNYLTPPHYGARIVSAILNDAELLSEWLGQIEEMCGRILKLRKTLKAKLEQLGTPGNWDHVVSQTGLFSYTGLSSDQVKFLVEERHIYMPRNSRINICGLNSKNIDYVTKAIHEAVTTFPDN